MIRDAELLEDVLRFCGNEVGGQLIKLLQVLDEAKYEETAENATAMLILGALACERCGISESVIHSLARLGALHAEREKSPP